MNPDFSPSPTRLDAVLWFLRVQLWLTIAAFLTSLSTPYFGLYSVLNVQNLATFGLNLLVLSLFPRLLAQSALGHTARDLLAVSDLRAFARQCIGLALFVTSLGRAVFVVFFVGFTFWEERTSASGAGGFGFYTSMFLVPQFVGTTLALVIGFFLAFGPAIRDNFRSHP